MLWIKLANIFQKNFNKYLNSNRKIQEISTLYMYKRITKPGLLLELGFISNPNDRYLLNQEDYQNKIVNVLAESLLEAF